MTPRCPKNFVQRFILNWKILQFLRFQNNMIMEKYDNMNLNYTILMRKYSFLKSSTKNSLKDYLSWVSLDFVKAYLWIAQNVWKIEIQFNSILNNNLNQNVCKDSFELRSTDLWHLHFNFFKMMETSIRFFSKDCFKSTF